MKMGLQEKVCNIKHGFADFSFDQNDKIGQGGFATVYKAKCNSSCYQPFVAIKEISKTDDKWKRHKHFVREEIEIHKNAHHPNIVKLYHHHLEDEKKIWLILELCSKGSLQDFSNKQKERALSEEETYKIFRQIVDGVAYLHSKSIIHRDLTLRNILLTEDMQVKIADFGLSTKLLESDEIHYTRVGTPKYLPPEMKKNEGHSDKADCWNLGCILYALLVGHPPMDEKEKIKYPSTISREAKVLLKKLLEKNPSKRICVEDVPESDFFKKHKYLERDSHRSGDSGNGFNKYTKENKIPVRSFDSGFNSKESERRKKSHSATKLSVRSNLINSINGDNRSNYQTPSHKLSTYESRKAYQCYNNEMLSYNNSSHQYPNISRFTCNQTGFCDNKCAHSGTSTYLHHSYLNQQVSSCNNPEKLSLLKLQQTPPLNAARLKPKSHHIKDRKIVVHISADNQVILECHKIKKNMTYVSEVLTISTDGMEIKVYNPPKYSLLADDCPPRLPSDSLEVKSYEYPNIIEAYMKKYLIAKKFVDTMRAKTPKLINNGPNAKFYVMENSPDPDCRMDFYDGISVIEKGMAISITHKCGKRVESSRKAVLEEEYRHEKENCKRILEFHESLESPNFPIVLGMVRNELYNNFETKAGKENIVPLSSKFSRSNNR